jgi:hypothetical protein
MIRRDRRLWFALFAATSAGALDQVGSYALSPPAHMYGSRAPIYLVHVLAIVVCLIAAVVGTRELRIGLERGKGTVPERVRFLAASTIVFAVFSLLLVIGNAFVTIMLVPGAEP